MKKTFYFTFSISSNENGKNLETDKWLREFTINLITGLVGAKF